MSVRDVTTYESLPKQTNVTPPSITHEAILSANTTITPMGPMKEVGRDFQFPFCHTHEAL